MEKFKVSVVIVTWNNQDDIVECLDSLKSQTYKDFNVVVVDNASTDRTINIIENEYKDFVDLVKLDSNKFLTGGNNYGISYSISKYSPEFILILNPDTKCDSNLMEELLTQMEDASVGAVGPKVKFYKNQNKGLINSAGLFYDGFNQAYDIGYMQKDNGQFDQVKEVFGVTGACILYRVKMLNQIGLYWERIKLYLDEVEMFIRVKVNGWKVVYDPKTTLYHKYMQSMDKQKKEVVGKLKKEAWLWIALRHYTIRGKVAMIWNYFFK